MRVATREDLERDKPSGRGASCTHASCRLDAISTGVRGVDREVSDFWTTGAGMGGSGVLWDGMRRGGGGRRVHHFVTLDCIDGDGDGGERERGDKRDGGCVKTRHSACVAVSATGDVPRAQPVTLESGRRESSSRIVCAFRFQVRVLVLRTSNSYSVYYQYEGSTVSQDDVLVSWSEESTSTGDGARQTPTWFHKVVLDTRAAHFERRPGVRRRHGQREDARGWAQEGTRPRGYE